MGEAGGASALAVQGMFLRTTLRNGRVRPNARGTMRALPEGELMEDSVFRRELTWQPVARAAALKQASTLGFSTHRSLSSGARMT